MNVELFGIHAMLLGILRCDDSEDRRVNAIGAGGEDVELPAFLPAVEEELARVLEFVAVHDAAENALGRDGGSIGGDDERDFALGHDGHGHFDDSVLPAPIAKMQSGWQRIRLVAGFAIEGNEASRRQIFSRELFHDYTDLPLPNPNRSGHDRPDGQKTEG